MLIDITNDYRVSGTVSIILIIINLGQKDGQNYRPFSKDTGQVVVPSVVEFDRSPAVTFRRIRTGT